MDAHIEVAMNKGTEIITTASIRRPDSLLSATLVSVEVSVPENCTDLEVRLWVGASAELGVSAVEIRPVQVAASPALVQSIN
jgi:hypothetical protein